MPGRYPAASAPAATHEDAINWIIEHQLSRRNLNREERDYLLGKRYNREKAQAKKAADGQTTAERIAEGEGLSAKTVRRAAAYTEAVDAIAENVGPSAAQEVRQGRAKMPADAVIAVAKQPPAEQPEAFAAAKGTKSKPKLRRMADAYDVEKAAARRQLRERAAVKAPDRPDLAKAVVDVNVAWLPEAIAAYAGELTEAQRRQLRAHLPDLLTKLTVLWQHARPATTPKSARIGGWTPPARPSPGSRGCSRSKPSTESGGRAMGENLAASPTGQLLEAVVE